MMDTTIRGYIRYEPEMKYTQSGDAMTKFTLYGTSAYEGKYSQKDRIVTWGNLAEQCYKFLDINDQVYVRGYYKERTWTTPEGKQKTMQNFVAKGVWIIESKEYNDIMRYEEEPVA